MWRINDDNVVVGSMMIMIMLDGLNRFQFIYLKYRKKKIGLFSGTNEQNDDNNEQVR